MRRFRDGFRTLATAYQEEVKTAVAEHLQLVCGTLDIIRNENVVLESEQDREFWEEVSLELQHAKEAMGVLKGKLEDMGY